VIEGWIEEIRKGNERHLEDVIIALMPDVRRQAEYKSRHYPSRRDDLIGAAYMGLVIAIQQIAEGSLEHDNYMAYIKTVTKRYMYEFVSMDHAVIVERRSKRDYQYVSIESMCEDVLADVQGVDTREFIDALKLDKQQSRILEGLINGEKQSKIAKSIDLAPKVVSRQIQSIRARGRALINGG